MLTSALVQLINMLGTPIAFALIVNGALAGAMALYAWRRKDFPGARPLVFVTVLAAVTAWLTAGHAQAEGAMREVWLRARFVAHAGMPIGVIVLCLEATGRPAWKARRSLGALIALSVFFAIAAWTTPSHQLFFKVPIDDPDSWPAIRLGAAVGPLFWLFIGFAAIATFFGVMLLLDQALRHGGVARRQYLILVLGLLTPTVGNLGSAASGYGGVINGPIWYGLSMLLFGYAIFRLGFLGLVPIARAVVFEEMSEGVLVLDAAGQVVDANGAAARLLGLEGPLVRRTAPELLESWPALAAALADRSPSTHETERGPYYLRAVVTPLSTAAPGRGHLVIIHDVTEARRTEAALQEASRARGDFLARMSHEIRTPMNGVIGLSGLLLQTSLDERQRAYARGVRQSAQALLRIVNDVLDFSRIDAGRLSLEVSAFEPRAVVAEAIDLVRLEAQAKGLTLRSEIDSDVPFTVMGDVGRLRQILINLLGNAIKFTPAGEVGVRLGLASSSDDGVVLRMAVSDTGIGIAPETIKRIFQPFVQAETTKTSRYGGSGLGLAICRQLVELMGGSIDVESEVGRGSTFVCLIPVSRAQADAADRVEQVADDRPTRRWSGRVLVVDDNTVNQLVMVQMLDARGVVADVAASGVEALAAWSSVPYDLVLMDCWMPEMDGFEATREIRRREGASRHTPVVAMTAAVMPADRERCLAAGMDEHMAKPVRVSELESMLDRFLPPASAAPAEHAVNAPGAAEDAPIGAGFDEVVRAYLDEAGGAVEAIRAAYARKDHGSIKVLAHRLKGSSWIVGASALAKICQRLEEDPGQPAETFDALSQALSRARVELGAGQQV